MESLKKIDHSAMTVNQVIIILLNVTAFVFNQPWLAGLVAAVMLLGTLAGRPGFGFIYHFTLKLAGWAKPHVLLDNPEPHRFAQGLIDARGQPRYVNQGIAAAEKLIQQLEIEDYSI